MRFVTSVIAGLLVFVAAAHAAPTVVSLEFDDGTSDQRQAAPLLAAHGMHATFYVNSGRVSRTNHMSWGQLQDLQAAGHEVTGHTIDHLHLTQVSTDTARTQICDDRTRLLAHGLVANDFAYPFGDHNATVERIVAGCGYLSGRLVSGLDSITACHGCPIAERMPPADAYAMRTPDSIRSTTPLDQVETYVSRARANGGGWIQLVMHHICDGCDTYSVSRATLSGLLDWLDGQQDVAVRTVADVMNPDPPVVGIVSPAEGAAGSGIVTITADGPGPDPRRVRFFADGKQLGTRTSAPWRWRWDTTNVAPGPHRLTALVEDPDGVAALSPAVGFTVR